MCRGTVVHFGMCWSLRMRNGMWLLRRTKCDVALPGAFDISFAKQLVRDAPRRTERVKKGVSRMWMGNHPNPPPNTPTAPGKMKLAELSARLPYPACSAQQSRQETVTS